MNTPRLIGLAGPAGSGKSTVAELLEQHGGYTVASFAEPMYRALSAIFGHEFMLAVRAGKEKPDDMLAGKSPRFLLQTLGTEWGRNTVDPHLWVWMAHRRWCNHADAHGDGARMVFADVRFGNEADMLRESGGQIWHILRQVGPVRDHVSESGVPFEAGDRLIENTGSLKQLERTIRDALDD